MQDSSKRSCCTRRCSIITEIILVLVGIFLVVQIFFVPNYVNDQYEEGLKDSFVITSKNRENNDSTWKHWISNDHSDSPTQYFSYYLYNITNPLEILDGGYPNLTELGPFVFERKVYRKRIVFMENDTIVSYRYDYDFQYNVNKSTSEHTLDDPIIVFDPAVVTMINSINTYFGSVDNVFDAFLQNKTGTRIYYFKSIYDILWNTSDYEIENKFGTDTFFSAISFASNNVEEYTGKGNYHDLRKLRKYFNYTSMSFWSCYNDTEHWNVSDYTQTDYYDDICVCEEVDDDSVIPACFFYESVEPSRESVQFPYNNWVTKNKELILWETEKYRKASYFYDHSVTKRNVEMYRFKVADETFYNGSNYWWNNHYNQFGHDGIVNLTSRKIHISIFQQTVAYISKGHFLDADYYIETVNNQMGLTSTPDSLLDDQYFDIEPRTGAILHRHLSYQVNLGVAPLRHYLRPSNFSNITNMVVPYYMVRVDAEATNEQYDKISNALLVVDTIIDASIYGGASFAAVCFILTFWLICRRKRLEKDLQYSDKRISKSKKSQSQQRQKQIMNRSNSNLPGMTTGLTATPSMGQANALPTSTPDKNGGYGSTSNLRAYENSNSNNAMNNKANTSGRVGYNDNDNDSNTDSGGSGERNERNGRSGKHGYSPMA